MVLTTGLATNSQAATGTFSYVQADTGRTITMDDPSDHFCYILSGPVSAVQNGTNSTAILYADANCDPNEFLNAAQPGQTLLFGSVMPQSVRFG
ncbi:hypothetical protein ACFY2W_06565 [Streptomyces sp. NPDC001262]|uniref:hypothetical protein n=1 Tax=unclassified Streptomyces TaxID=2593676 RepID=UPI00369A31D3